MKFQKKYLFIPIVFIIVVFQVLIHTGILMLEPSISMGPITIRWYALTMLSAILVYYFGSVWILEQMRTADDSRDYLKSVETGRPADNNRTTDQPKTADNSSPAVQQITADDSRTAEQQTSRKQPTNSIDIDNLILFAGIPALIFARAWHVITDWYLYESNPVEALYIWQGGLSIFGAVIGAVIGIYIFTRINKINFYKLLNLLAIFLPLAQVIGRYGNLINRELFGGETALPWGLYIPESHPNYPFGATSEYFHPAYLYEQIGNLVLFGVMFFIYKKYKFKYNVFLPIWLIGYGLIRFVVEFYRLGYVLDIGLTFSQVTTIFMMIAGIILLGLEYRKHVKQN